jgi:hypothetical protein
LRFITAAFLVLHGLVHLLYFGQSRRLFELQPGLAWPDGSWALSRLLGQEGTRRLAGAACLIAAVLFAAGGGGLLAGQAWWQPAALGAAAFSTVLYVLCWDGGGQRLPDQGAIAVLINAAILFVVLGTGWLDFGF